MNVRKNWIEWTVFALALVIVGACVAMLIRSMLARSDEPPDLVITTGAATRASSGFRVPIEVRNDGDQTAEQVTIEVLLGNRERGEITFLFIPRKSKREGFVVFRTDPSCCEITTRAVGFGQP